METEQQLLSAIRGGDRQAMRRLYDRYSGYAMAVGLRYVPEREDVRDVLQDCFVKVLTNIGSFEYRGEGSLKNWVLRVMVNQSLDFLKKHRRMELTPEIPDLPEEEEADVGDVPPDELTAMIGRLPTGYRTVLNLYVFEQLSHQEIARQLGISKNTSATQFLRARRLLTKMIKEYLKRQAI